MDLTLEEMVQHAHARLEKLEKAGHASMQKELDAIRARLDALEAAGVHPAARHSGAGDTHHGSTGGVHKP
jgi:hypothetical protein